MNNENIYIISREMKKSWFEISNDLHIKDVFNMSIKEYFIYSRIKIKSRWLLDGTGLDDGSYDDSLDVYKSIKIKTTTDIADMLFSEDIEMFILGKQLLKNQLNIKDE